MQSKSVSCMHLANHYLKSCLHKRAMKPAIVTAKSE